MTTESAIRELLTGLDAYYEHAPHRTLNVAAPTDDQMASIEGRLERAGVVFGTRYYDSTARLSARRLCTIVLSDPPTESPATPKTAQAPTPTVKVGDAPASTDHPMLPLIRRVRAILRDCPGTACTGATGPDSVGVSLGSDSSLSWAMNALDASGISYSERTHRRLTISGSQPYVVLVDGDPEPDPATDQPWSMPYVDAFDLADDRRSVWPDAVVTISAIQPATAIDNPALSALRRNVSGKVESGEAKSIAEIPVPSDDSLIDRVKSCSDSRACEVATDLGISYRDAGAARLALIARAVIIVRNLSYGHQLPASDAVLESSFPAASTSLDSAPIEPDDPDLYPGMES